MTIKFSNRYILFLLAPLLLFVGAENIRAEVQPLDSIVAVVNEDVIMRSELDQAVAGVMDRIRQSGGNMPGKALLENQVIENLISTKLQVQRAHGTGIRVSDSDIDSALGQVASQNKMSIEQLRGAIERDGFNFTEFRQSLGDDMMMRELKERVVGSMVNVTESEINILLATRDLDDGEFLLSHIMISVPEGATPEQLAEGTDRINDVYRRLQEGMDFKSAAISYSEAPEALEGGTVGWRDLNSIPRYFAEAIEPLGTGGYTEAMRSPAGYHIFRVDDKRERGKVVIKEYNARHIMIQVTELRNARQAMDKVMDIKKQLAEGADFETLAKSDSDDTTSANLGGDLGWFVPEKYGDRMKVMLEGLGVEGISEPFQTEAGWHIAQFLGQREVDRTEETTRNQARNMIRQRKAEQEVNQFLRQMRDEAYVDIRIDAG
ncbi:MAG: peptidylprolyl isomerase [Xanthomonadales bacterium]|nr:peptidylprolyl isomerase [Xanthomonadales bacterium]